VLRSVSSLDSRGVLCFRWARVTVLPHRLHLKASLSFLGQSASSPIRISSSLHLLHSSMIHPEGSIGIDRARRQDVQWWLRGPLRVLHPSPALPYSWRLAWAAPRDTIETGGPPGPLGCPPPYDPRGAAIGPTLVHKTTVSRRLQREVGGTFFPFRSLTLRSRFRVAISSPSNRSGSKASPSRQMDLELTPAMCAQDMPGGTCAVIAELLS
jgi:hypothetical protein